MKDIFFNCAELKSLDLSNFQAKSVTSTNEMFKGCSALEYLDISNFNFDSLDSMVSMFDGLSNIKYINIYNITNDILINVIKSESLLNKDGITVCQKEQIITNPNAIYRCYILLIIL
jgi:surface protein